MLEPSTFILTKVIVYKRLKIWPSKGWLRSDFFRRYCSVAQVKIYAMILGRTGRKVNEFKHVLRHLSYHFIRRTPKQMGPPCKLKPASLKQYFFQPTFSTLLWCEKGFISVKNHWNPQSCFVSSFWLKSMGKICPKSRKLEDFKFKAKNRQLSQCPHFTLKM